MHPLRSLRQTSAVTLVALLTLALGIGAAVTIFSVVDAVLLRPLPYLQPQRLVSVRESTRKTGSMSASWPDYLDWAADNHSFTQLAAYENDGMLLTRAGAPVELGGQAVTWTYFSLLGVAPELGRTFTPAEDRPSASDVVVLSDQLWRQRFGARRDILGQTIELGGKPRTVVGVMPPGFPGLERGEFARQFWAPFGAEAVPGSHILHRDDHSGMNALGRLKPGVSLADARADLETIERGLAQQYPQTNAGVGVAVETYLAHIVHDSGPSILWMLLAAAGLLLLIACANVANLLLAKSTARRKANAVRAALGASRARLVREQMAESLLLGAAGAAGGILLAVAAMRGVRSLIPFYMVRADQLSLDGRVLGFAAALALVTSVVFGLAPAWQASQSAPVHVLKEGGRDMASGGAGLRSGLVVAEMGLAVLPLVGAGLLMRSMVRLLHVDPGFHPRGVASFMLDLPQSRYTKPGSWIAFDQAARTRLARIPGVTAVGTMDPLPLGGNDMEAYFSIAGRPAPPAGQQPLTNFAMVSGDIFSALGMRLLRGRGFDSRDTATSPAVCLVDDTFGRRYWPGADSLGAALGRVVHANDRDLTIVGVFARVHQYDLADTWTLDRSPELYVPFSQAPWVETGYVLRTRLANPAAVRSAATAAIQSVDPDLPLNDFETMDQRVALSVGQQTLTLWLMGAFAFLALVLAAIGIYGVLSYMVAQRSHEIGVRMALGAGQPRVLALVLGQGMRLATAGAAGGLVAALLLGQFATSFLFGISPHDALTLITVPVVLLAIAALACYVPALRATRVDPCVALRGE